MIYLFTALYAEAKPLIRRLSLKECPVRTGFRTWMDEDRRYCLVLSGVGVISAATAVGSTLAAFGIDEDTLLVNWGSCAGETMRRSNKFAFVGKCIDQCNCSFPKNNNGKNDCSCPKNNDAPADRSFPENNSNRADCSFPDKLNDSDSDFSMEKNNPNASTASVPMVYLCKKLTDRATGYTFYPDILLKSSLPEAELITEPQIYRHAAASVLTYPDSKNVGSNALLLTNDRTDPYKTMVSGNNAAAFSGDSPTPAQTENNESNTASLANDIPAPSSHEKRFLTSFSSATILHDMEAAAIYQAGAFFLAPHRMHFIKVVSDKGDGALVTEPSVSIAKQLEAIMEAASDQMMEYLELLQSYANAWKSTGTTRSDVKDPLDDHPDWLNEIFEDFCCTKTMQSSLLQCIRYWHLAGLPYQAALDELRQNGLLPCKNKKEGMKLMDSLKKEMLAVVSVPNPEKKKSNKTYITENKTLTPVATSNPKIEVPTTTAAWNSASSHPSLNRSIETHTTLTAPSLKINPPAEASIPCHSPAAPVATTCHSPAASPNAPFSHIYIETALLGHPTVRALLEKFPDAEVTGISHYKDVFCRKKQDIRIQGQSPALILASKQGRLIYPGAPVCQSFDHPYFYYTSCVMNCLYQCEYCYLKGMYPSGHLVIFVNLEDIFAEVEALLTKHPVYLSVSYDTDLMALEDLTGFVKKWTEFTAMHPELTIEIRTKCGRTDLWSTLSPSPNVIFAFTMSPQEIISHYEHRTSSLAQRIHCASKALEMGFSVRLCFDPILYHPDWKTCCQNMLDEIFAQISMEELTDVSVGSFRISKDQIKRLRQVMKHSAIVQFPFEQEQGVYHYPHALMQEMEEFLIKRLKTKLPGEKIFRWQPE